MGDSDVVEVALSRVPTEGAPGREMSKAVERAKINAGPTRPVTGVLDPDPQPVAECSLAPVLSNSPLKPLGLCVVFIGLDGLETGKSRCDRPPDTVRPMLPCGGGPVPRE